MAKKIRGRNEGSLSQRSNKNWQAQIYNDGKRISHTFTTKQAAQVWLRQMQGQLEQGLNYQGTKTTLAEYLPQWLENSRITLRENTAYHYALVVRKHILPRIGKLQLKDLTLARVEQFYSQLIQDGIGIRTVRITHNILHKALEKAVRYRLILYNPCHGAALPRYKHGEMKVLDQSQVTTFLIAAQDSPYQALYHLAVVTGMRQGELFGLKWSDLQWTSGILHVQRQAHDIAGKGASFSEPKTKSGRRTIALGDNTLQVLRQHRNSEPGRISTAGNRWKDNDLIFPSTFGTPINPSNMRLDFNQVLVKAGLPKIRFHDLRHTAASLMLNHGVPAIVVSKILGHSKPSITLDIYGHLYVEMKDEAAKLMDQLVSPIRVAIPSEKQNHSF